MSHGSTRRQRRERQHILEREPLCYLRYPGCTGTATIDEHVVARALGGTDDLDNRRGACAHCNRVKATAERRAVNARRKQQPEPHPGFL